MNRLGGLALYTLGYLVILELMLVGAIVYWPNFEENLDSIRSLAAPIPALGDLLTTIEDTGVYGYIVGQHFFKGCNTLGTAAAVLFAVGAVAGEVHRGTLEIFLARPFSRTRLLTERFVGGAVGLVVPVFLTSLTIPWLADRIDEVELYGPYLLGSVHQSLFLLSIYSLAFLCSALGSNPTKIALLLLFLTISGFAIYMIKVVTDWSPYRLCDMEVFLRISDTGSLDPRLCVPMVLWILGMYGASLAAFRRRVP